MKTISIEIPSLTENIRMIESFIDNAKEKYELEDDIYGNILIAVTESVGNAIIHGNNGDKDRTVALSLSLENNSIRFQIKDKGNGFDYEKLPDPTAPENLGKIGGRGIFLIKHLSDEVTFKDNGSCVELCFYLKKIND